MSNSDRFKVIRDPLWNNIQIDANALEVLDSEPFQRLRYVRQLGHAFLVYPGATHTRFEHAVGTYHLARRALIILDSMGLPEEVTAEDRRLVQLAALLHDIGHYPFSHGLEEAGLPSHEDLALHHMQHPELVAALRHSGIDNVSNELFALIKGSSARPLAGLISGSLDLDKIEYLNRDARMCGVPYGDVDVDRLLHALTVVRIPDGRLRVGVREKGISALESLLFARYQMYRNVYWHHAVRSATVMFKRVVRTALTHGEVSAEWIADATDDSLMTKLRELPNMAIAHKLQRRALYKRMVDIPSRQLPDGAGDWIATKPDLLERVEDQLAEECGLAAGELLLDYPRKSRMVEVDMPLAHKNGDVEMLQGKRGEALLGIQLVAEELHTSARWLRVFASSHVDIAQNKIIAVAERSVNEIEADLKGGTALLN